MKKLFLTSLFNQVGNRLTELVPNVKGLKIAFIPTAADVYDSKPWMEADRQKLITLGFVVEDYDVKGKTENLIYNDLKDKDAIFVAGGNTFYLLYHVRQSGFDKAVVRLVSEGKLYIGSSAGSIVAGPNIEPVKALDNSDQAPKLQSFEGLGLINTVILPHYGKQKYEERYQTILKEWSGKVKLQTLTDDQALIINGKEQRIV